MKLKSLLIVFAFAVLLASCSTPAIYSPKALDELITDLKTISSDYTIESVSVNETDKLKGDFGHVNVYLRDSEGREYIQQFFHNSLAENKPLKSRSDSDDEDEWKSRKLPPALTIEEIAKQKGNIEKYIDEAVRQVTEGFDGKYDFRSVQRLEFSADEAGALQIQFTLNATPKDQSAQIDGRRITTTYYELNFIVDKDGKVVPGE